MAAQPDFVIDIPIGSTLGGKYRVDKLLGQGGMGAVYLAENIDIGRKVAIKILHADFARDQQVLQRFRMEARAAASIGHPGIVDVLDLGQTAEGAEFIVMERLDGETLGSRIKRQNVMQAGEVVPIICEVLDALAAAHEKKIVHRDLKPENVFLCERPVKQAKILDFGISKFGGAEDVSLTRTGTVMGSPLYMSPEQARGAKDIGPGTDLYSIGAILYEALGGVPPFNGATYNEVIANVLMEQHKPLVEIKPDVPPELSKFVDRMLAKFPAERPQDARAAKLELKRAFDPSSTDVDMPTVPHTEGRSAHPAPSVARASIAPEAATRPAPDLPTAVVREQRKTALMVVGLGMVVVLGAAGFAVWKKSQHVAPAPVAIAPPPPPPVEKAKAPEKIELKLAADPAAASWSLDGEPLHCNPCTVVRDQGTQHVATASAPGFADARLELVFDRAREEKAQLQSTKVAAPPPRPHHDRGGTVEKPADKPADKPVEKKPPEKKDPALNIDKDNPFK